MKYIKLNQNEFPEYVDICGGGALDYLSLIVESPWDGQRYLCSLSIKNKSDKDIYIKEMVVTIKKYNSTTTTETYTDKTIKAGTTSKIDSYNTSNSDYQWTRASKTSAVIQFR